MAKYKGIVTTDAGLELLAKACSGGSVKFTAVKTGDGAYDGTEDLSGMTALKSEKQSFGVSGITRIGTQVKVRSVLSNEGLTTGYNITEIGLFAKDPETGSEILYAIIVAETGLEDYLPPHEESPSSITMEIYLMLTETENAVTFTAEVVAGTYASAEAFQEFVDNVTGGTTQVGNAKTLDGHEAEYFFPKSGGRVSAKSTAPLELQSENSTNTLVIPLYNQNGEPIGTLGFREGKPIVRIGDSKWYDMLHSNNISEFALSLLGGTIDGNITLVTTGTSTRAIILKNNIREVDTLMYGTDGNYALRDITNSRNIFTATADGTNTWNGTASGNLPLNNTSMPTVNTNHNNTFGINNTGESGTYCWQHFKLLGELLGAIGFDSKNKLLVSIPNVGIKDILHTGNKPTGTYTGNGTQRTINIGGIGSVVLVKSKSSNDFAFVLTNGYIGVQGENVVRALNANFNESTKIMALSATNTLLNASGVEYEYNLL